MIADVAKLWSRMDRGALLRLLGVGIGVSLVLNLTALVTPLFFTQVYDRVLTTGSADTLIVLTVVAMVVIGLGAAFEIVRGSALLEAGAALYAELEARVYEASHQRALAGAQGRRGQAFDDLESLRALLSGPLPAAALDLLFAPLFLTVLFLIHFYVGLFALGVLIVMTLITVFTQWAIAASMRTAQESQLIASNLAESQLRASEAVAAMGFVQAARQRWAIRSRDAVRDQVRSAVRAGGLTASARAVRSGAQIAVIAIAAGLALMGAVSAGAIIACSIILGRLLTPIDQLLGGWRQLAQAHHAAGRLVAALPSAAPPPESDSPPLRGRLVMDTVTAAAPPAIPILRGVSLSVEPGEIVALIGAVGAGKSTVLRCALGIWPQSTGSVRLDGVPLKHAHRDQVGRFLGFLPQNAELIPGTVAENVRRFGPPDDALVLAAIEQAGARELISSLPQGFDTDVGEGGAALSAGQRRRVALARALYGAPVLVCLDEPEAHLDRDGELALAAALNGLRARGAAVLIAAHRPSVVALADRIAVLKDGRIVQIGPTAEILKTVAPQPLRQAQA